MLRFLLFRPIAVIMLLIAFVAISIISFFRLPISLLPDIDVPEISIIVKQPSGSPEEIEQNVLRPIREVLLTVNGLKSIESIAQQEAGSISIQMEYGMDMDLAYIEVNEKIDRLTSVLPENVTRPQVVKTNTSDIPIVRIQVIPKDPTEQISTSQLVNTVLKRRLEQIEGVSLVDINGYEKEVIRIIPDYAKLKSLKLTDADITTAIQSSNLELGSLSVHDGNYRYFLKLSTRLNESSKLGSLPIKIPGTKSVVQLSQVARVQTEPEKEVGFHFLNGRQGIVITVHKQSQARMPDIMPEVYKTVEQFKIDYPTIDFSLTQDQSELLTLSIQNLSQALIWGGAFAFGVLFLFMGGWREPLVMGIVLPVSLILSFALLNVFGISLNIISLSGLALGLGMLVDNSIVIIDNIVLNLKSGQNLIESCVKGTSTVAAPLLSSALTNLAVFIPLIFMSGITGALFYDQAIAVFCILSVSIICTFVLVPLFYYLLNRNREVIIQEDSRFYIRLKSAYHRSFVFVWKHKTVSLILMSTMIPISIILLITLPKQGFPDIERTESMLSIDWNEPIDVNKSKERVSELNSAVNQRAKISEAEIGIQQFVFSTNQTSSQSVLIYLRYNSELEKDSVKKSITEVLKRQYPKAAFTFKNAPNAFEQLFISTKPKYEVRFRDPKSKRPIDVENNVLLSQGNSLGLSPGKGFETEPMVFLELDFARMKLYSVSYNSLVEKLKIVFGDYTITDLKNFGEVVPVMFEGSKRDFDIVLKTTDVPSEDGNDYSLGEFIKYRYQLSYKNVTADQSGIYQSLISNDIKDVKSTSNAAVELGNQHNLITDIKGTWLEDEKNLNQLLFILVVSLFLMYFIITAEFESFKQPLIVMLSIPIGFAGSLLFLWVSGGTINVMSGIGLIVVLGVLDNDAILKIDRINRLREELPIAKAIEQAGLDRFKPIVMNTCTNVLALTPILFSSGIGADLQRPIAITTIGGLILATFAALYFVPIVYWKMYAKDSIARD